jgi:mannose-6-phosphate isomerase-like protein (cupin superfamily)
MRPVPARVCADCASTCVRTAEEGPSRQGENVAKHIKSPAVVEAQGTPPKAIAEFVGRVNTGTSDLSIARMKSPAGWSEPGQRAEFDEYSVVFAGLLRADLGDRTVDVRAGEAIVVAKGEWVQYSSPAEGGAEYISVCLPAFSPEMAHRDEG